MQTTTADYFDSLPGYRRNRSNAQTVEISAATLAECAALWYAIQEAQAQLDASVSVVVAK